MVGGVDCLKGGRIGETSTCISDGMSCNFKTLKTWVFPKMHKQEIRMAALFKAHSVRWVFQWVHFLYA